MATEMDVKGEIITEIVGDKILLHGIGIHPYASTRMTGLWDKRKSQRQWAVRMAQHWVVNPVVVLTEHHPTGRIYEIRTYRS